MLHSLSIRGGMSRIYTLAVNPPLVYRAIKMNVRLFKWQRALELAGKHKQHGGRDLILQKEFLGGKEETDPRFRQYFQR